jgi:hypothetical protein
VEPKDNPLAGVSRVFVIEISPAVERGVAHSLQNLAESRFSVRHFGQLVATSSPLFGRQNIIKENVRCQIESIADCKIPFHRYYTKMVEKR